MNKKQYIHYGHKNFEKESFNPIKNRFMYTKPWGGFWASATDSKYGWKQWNDNEHFTECDENNSFSFHLIDDAKVIHIHSVDDLKDLPKADTPEQLKLFDKSTTYIDFEDLAKTVDAIELHLSEEKTNMCSMEGLYWRLYGWDCDSILIMNPNIIIPD